MAVIVSALLVTAALAWAGAAVARELAARRREAAQQQMLALFAPAIVAAQDDPPRLLAWYRLARTARTLYPEAFEALDAASGARFPFTRKQLQAAHASWTTQWLAWERAHDADYRLRTAAIEAELGSDSETSYGRARIEAVEQEKLERYQQRYEEYIRIAKALAALEPDAAP